MKVLNLLALVSLCCFIYIVYTSTDKYYLEQNYYQVKVAAAQSLFHEEAFGEGIAPRILPVNVKGYGMEPYMEFGITGYIYSDWRTYHNEVSNIVLRDQLVRITGEGIRNKDGWLKNMFGKNSDKVLPVIEINGQRHIVLESEFRTGYLIPINR